MELTKFLYHLKIISWNQLYSKLFTKEIVFTEIFQKVVVPKFRKMYTLSKLRNFTATVFSQKFRQINVLQGIFRFSPLCGNYGTQCGLCKNEKFTATNIFFRQFNFYFSLVEQLIWRNFAAVKVCNFWILKCAEFSSGTIIW